MNREEGNRASLFACAAALAVVGLVGVAWGAPERTAPKKDVEVVAVYYPHWHNYPKGIEWFGEKWKTGEWDFVKTARRLFPGHKQPLVPTPGYLDGANPKDVETEIALAANAGIDVFLWDYYWYGGKVTQEESIEQGFLKAKNRDRMKFALMWCYHERNDQFRPGLGPERRRLMSLDHTPEEFLGLIDHAIARYFNQPEYWRKDGKLFFSVYNAAYLLKTWGGDTAKVRAAMDEARRRVRAAGLGELHLNAQNLQPAQVPLAVEMGFDSLTDYNLVASYAPNYWKRYAAGERLFGYDEIGAGIESRWKAMQATALPYFPNVSTGWDSTPRCRLDVPFPWPKTAQYPYCATLTNNTPDRFEAYLRAAKAHVLADPKKPGVVYVNGWNEYTEGTYLLPNNFDSDGFLRAIAAVFGRQPANVYTYVNPSTKQLLTVPAATHENVAYGPHPKQKVDVFLPPGAKGPTPVVVYLHGGGWTGGAMVDHILGTSLKPLLARGVAVVAVGYRYIRDARRRDAAREGVPRRRRGGRPLREGAREGVESRRLAPRACGRQRGRLHGALPRPQGRQRAGRRGARPDHRPDVARPARDAGLDSERDLRRPRLRVQELRRLARAPCGRPAVDCALLARCACAEDFARPRAEDVPPVRLAPEGGRVGPGPDAFGRVRRALQGDLRRARHPLRGVRGRPHALLRRDVPPPGGCARGKSEVRVGGGWLSWRWEREVEHGG